MLSGSGAGPGQGPYHGEVRDEGDYELIDAGDERRLERFGDRIVDRPAPAALGPRRDPDGWAAANLRFDRPGGWSGPAALTPWQATIDGLTLELRPTPTGQVGLFPEHADNLGWLAGQAGALQGLGAGADGRPLVLNLFAYTGLGTLALARAGAAVVHVDAARPTVAWARRNAELSGLAEAPIRWIVDEAETFVARELRRGRRYDGIVLDPPSYGHGVGGRSWQLDEQLPGLLASCARLLTDAGFTLLTAHSRGHAPERLADLLAEALGRGWQDVDAHGMELEASSGARLSLGAVARVAS